MNIVTKETPSLRKPPEVPALVMAARERVLNQKRCSSPFDKSKFKKKLNETAPLKLDPSAFPVRL